MGGVASCARSRTKESTTPIYSELEISDSSDAQACAAFCRRNRSATLALAFLTFVAVTKTILTKLVFTHVHAPVAFSVLSCLATNLCLAPVFLAKPSLFQSLQGRMLRPMLGVCLAIAIDLACTNVAISLLSVALQQCIKATSPAATVVLESLMMGKLQHPAIYLAVGLICVGPVLTHLGSQSFDSTPFGVLMMVVAVLAGAFKYVLAHAIIRDFRSELGTLAFTFWVEVFVALMLTPWAVLNGEARFLLYGTASSAKDWALLLFTAAYGGVRIYSQFALLSHTTATTLSMSNLTIQAGTIILGIYVFHTLVTPYLVAGVAETIAASALYTYLKLSDVLKPKPVVSVAA